jgi:hypothetical protein
LSRDPGVPPPPPPTPPTLEERLRSDARELVMASGVKVANTADVLASALWGRRRSSSRVVMIA